MWTYIIATVVAIAILLKIYEYLSERPERMRNFGCIMGCSGLGLFLLVVVGIGVLIYYELELDKPDLPVVVSHRDSLVGIGKVLIVENQSDQDLRLELHCVSQSSGQWHVYNINVPARQAREYGWMELDWQFESGEDIIICHPDYKTLTKQFR